MGDVSAMHQIIIKVLTLAYEMTQEKNNGRGNYPMSQPE
jgi:hypothetical protein